VGGTLCPLISDALLGRRVVVGTDFYNNALAPCGLILLAATAPAPLLRWGAKPTAIQKGLLATSALVALAAACAAWALAVRHPLALAVAGLAAAAACAATGSLLLDARNGPGPLGANLWRVLRDKRPQYAGFLIHGGLFCLAIGVTGSALGTRQTEAILEEGGTISFAGRAVRLRRVMQRELPDRLVAEAWLEVSRDGRSSSMLRPARHLHLLQNEWTTEVAIQADWSGDFYAVLQSGEGAGRVRLTLVENPLMRFIWLGGWVMGLGALARLWPGRRRSVRPESHSTAGSHLVGRRPELAAVAARCEVTSALSPRESVSL